LIQYMLVCDSQHRFESWFRNADAYEQQAGSGLVACPQCGSVHVGKAPMAPAVARSGEKLSVTAGHPSRQQIAEMLRAIRRKVTEEADYVGDRFAEEARAIHFKEAEARGIYGEATSDEVSGLIEDGIEVLPLPPVPDEAN
jgi:hypothetical protein